MTQTKDDPIYLIYEDLGVQYVADDRFRVKGGTVVHRAAVLDGGPHTDDGFTVVLVCDTETHRWFNDGEDERLDLIQPDDAEVTCSECQRITERIREQQDE